MPSTGKPKILIYRDGRYRRICAIVEESGRCEARSYLDDRSDTHRASLLGIMDLVANRLVYRNEEKFKKLKGRHAEGVVEFKRKPHRVMGFVTPNGDIVLTHGFKKDSGDTPRSEIERVKNFRDKLLPIYLASELDAKNS